MSAKGRAGTDQGTAVNILANDAEKLMMGMFAITMLGSFPVMIVSCLVMLYEEVQGAAFAGFGTMLVLFMSLGKVMGGLGMVEAMRMMQADKRIKLTNEVISGINIIKFYTWEDPFSAKIEGYRGEELRELKRKAKYQVALYAVMTGAPILVILVTIATYVGTGGELNAVKLFTVLVLLELLRFPMMMLPMVIVQVVTVKVSLNRMLGFMEAEEVKTLDPAYGFGTCSPCSAPSR